jgi:hypothetical protein
MMDTKEIELKLTVAEVNGVLSALGQMPFVQVSTSDSEDSAAGRTASSGRTASRKLKCKKSFKNTTKNVFR